MSTDQIWNQIIGERNHHKITYSTLNPLFTSVLVNDVTQTMAFFKL